MAKRKKGAQPSNVNAVKSGFYGRLFTEEEVLEIGRLAVAELTLDEEISMLRVLMRRVVDSKLDAGEACELFGRATGQLRRLIATRADLERQGESQGSVEAAMAAALDELSEELGVEL